MVSLAQRRHPNFFLSAWLAFVVVAPSPVQSDDKPKGPDPLPPLNAKVAEFARAHVGEPVGDGICITLAVEALRASGAKRFPFVPSGDYVWGEPVADLKVVLPGDILQFRDAVFAGSRTLGGGRRETWRETYPHHTAIVVRTQENGRLVTISHQNIAIKGDDPAKVGVVRESVLRMNSLQKGGQIRAYRPVAPDPARRPSSIPRDPEPSTEGAAEES